jgi:hypothetical protein
VQVWQTINYTREGTRVELYSERLAKRDIAAGHVKPETMVFQIVEEGPTVYSQAGDWPALIPLFQADIMATFTEASRQKEDNAKPKETETATAIDTTSNALSQERSNLIDYVRPGQPVAKLPHETKTDAASALNMAAPPAAVVTVPPIMPSIGVATPPLLPNQMPPVPATALKPISTDEPFLTANDAPARKAKSKNESLMVLGIFALIAFLIYLFVGAQNGSSSQASSGICCANLSMGQQNGLHVRVKANVRTAATSRGNQPVGQLERDTIVGGTIVQGEDGTSRWLKLDDGSGYLSANVLSTIAGPKLSGLIDADRFTTTEISVLAEPRPDADVRLVLPTGTRYYLVGDTNDGYEEVMVRNTSVQFGYIKTTP